MVLFGIRHWALDISFKLNKGGCLNIPIIDLKIFAPKYRQALLYAMIEGLNEGSLPFHSLTTVIQAKLNRSCLRPV